MHVDREGCWPSVKLAELEDLLGQCYEATAKADEAESSFLRAIAHDPARVAAYARLARVQRQALKKPTDADRQIEAMVAKNPGSALALVERYRYRREFGLAETSPTSPRPWNWDPTKPTC